jgi:hypothetical protein
MKMPWSNFEGPAKLVVFCLTIFLVAGGLCGLQWAISNGMHSGVDNLAVVFAITGILELGVMLLSLAAMIGGALVWMIAAIRRGRSG